MSATWSVTIWCDHLGGGVKHGISFGEGTATEARVQARRHGWVRRNFGGVLVDLCPEHVDRAASAVSGTEDQA